MLWRNKNLNILVPRNLHTQLSYATSRNSEKTGEVCDVSTHGQKVGENQKDSSDNNLGTFGYIRGHPSSHFLQASTTTHRSQWRHHSPSYIQAGSIRSLTHAHNTSAVIHQDGFHTSTAANQAANSCKRNAHTHSNFVDTGDQKINDIQVRFNKLPDIFCRYDTAESELELSDDVDQSGDREQFENRYYQVEAKFSELLHPVVDPPRSSHSSSQSSSSGLRNVSPMSDASSAHIKLPVISLPTYDGDTCHWLQFRDTFQALIVNNSTLSNVQKFHYLIASLRNEAKDVISNLKITNENFLVAWN